MAGLDPAIQHLRKMDARVKPAHDDGVGFNPNGKRTSSAISSDHRPNEVVSRIC
jgi:hypothetical protein